MSGLSRTPGKRVWVYPHRGFESRPLRHEQQTVSQLTAPNPTKTDENQALSGVFCCLKPNEPHMITPFTTGSL